MKSREKKLAEMRAAIFNYGESRLSESQTRISSYAAKANIDAINSMEKAIDLYTAALDLAAKEKLKSAQLRKLTKTGAWKRDL